jgi:hypothetical protein
VTHETISYEDVTRRSTRQRLNFLKNNEYWDNENFNVCNECCGD